MIIKARWLPAAVQLKELNDGDLFLIQDGLQQLLALKVTSNGQNDAAVLRAFGPGGPHAPPMLVPWRELQDSTVRRITGPFRLEPQFRNGEAAANVQVGGPGALAIQDGKFHVVMPGSRGVLRFDLQSGERVDYADPCTHLVGWRLMWCDGDDEIELHQFA
jgi:hypothetical protein